MGGEAGCLERDPVADLVNCAYLLGDGDELGRADAAELGMVPPDEGLGLDMAARGEFDDGLVGNKHLATLGGAEEGLGNLEGAARRGIGVWVRQQQPDALARPRCLGEGEV